MLELQKTMLQRKEKRGRLIFDQVAPREEGRRRKKRILSANQYRPDAIYWPRCDNSDPWQDIAHESKKGFWIC